MVKEIDLKAVTGSVPGARGDIDDILELKRTTNFELLVVQDATRFTRAGPDHGMKLIYELRAVGISIYFVAEGVLVEADQNNDLALIYISFLFSAAHHAVKMLVFNSMVGGTEGFLSGSHCTAKHRPMGLTGRVSGKDKRQYAVGRAESAPKSNNVFQRRIDADPLEEAVISVARDVVLTTPNLQELLRQLIEQNQKSVQEDVENPAALEKQIRRKKKQLVLLSDAIQDDDDDDNALSSKCNKLKAEIRALQLRRQQAPQQMAVSRSDTDAIAARFAKELQDSAEGLGDMRNAHTYRLLELLISGLELDMETMEVEIHFILPSWIGTVLHQTPKAGLDLASACRPVNKAQPENMLKFADFRCEYTDHKGDKCVQCHRRIAA